MSPDVKSEQGAKVEQATKLNKIAALQMTSSGHDSGDSDRISKSLDANLAQAQ